MLPEPDKLETGKPWYARWSIVLGIVGSIAIGVATNFLTDYLKFLYTNYDLSATAAHISMLEAKLDTMHKANSSAVFYMSFLSSRFFEATKQLIVSLTALLIMATMLVTILSRMEIFEASTKPLRQASYAGIIIAVVTGVSGVTNFIISYRTFSKCYDFANGMLDYDKTVYSIQAEISEFKNKKN